MTPNGETTAAPALAGRRVFIAYKRNCEPDESLAKLLSELVARQGHDVFIDVKTPVGNPWSDLIENEITTSDFFVVLLTKQSVAPGYVVAETLFARRSEDRTGRPKILPVRVAFEGRLPVILDGAIGHLHQFEWSDRTDNEVLLKALLQRIGKPGRTETRPSALMRGDHFIITRSMWDSGGSRESLAGTTIVPVSAGEELELAVTRAKGPGFFGVRIPETGILEVAIWKGTDYRGAASQPGRFVEMIQGDYNKWCFASHKPEEAVLLRRPDGRKDPIVITFDQDLVRSVWTITHQRGKHREDFLVVMKEASA